MYSRKTMYFMLAVLFALQSVLPGCMRSGPNVNAKLEDVIAMDSGSRQDIKAINERLFSSVRAAPGPQDYVLGQGDLLVVSIFEAPELKTEARISARGAVTLPLVGSVDVKGITTREAEQKIESMYAKKYLNNPHVNVFVKEQVSGKITILGAVKKPGIHPYLTRQTLFEALAKGEGLSDQAGKMIQVRRQGDDPEHPTTFLVDLDELAHGGGSQLNMEIRPGDVIYVPEAGSVYVDGAVRKRGSFPLRRKMTIPEVIIAAGGFAEYADENDIKLVRSKGGGEPEIVKLSFKELQTGAEKIEVKDRDIIFVETNKVKAFIYGLQITGLGGIVGVGWQPPRSE